MPYRVYYTYVHYSKGPAALTRALELFSPRPSGGEHLATSAAIGLAVGSLEREPQNTSLDHLIWLCTVFVALRACYAALGRRAHQRLGQRRLQAV